MDRLVCGPTRRSQIVFVEKPWGTLTSYDAGWLAGALDGEGYVAGSKRMGKRTGKYGTIGFSQNVGDVYDRFVTIAETLGFALRAREDVAEGTQTNRGRHSTTHVKSHVRGGTVAWMRLIGSVRPVRLLPQFVDAIQGKQSHHSWRRAVVHTRADAGVQDVVDITTTAGTFIANGFVVHNCGQTGKVVDRMLAAVGRPRKEIWITNTTLCIKDGATDDDKAAAVRACRPRLLHELRRFPGKPILALGGYAARAVIPHVLQLSKAEQIAAAAAMATEAVEPPLPPELVAKDDPEYRRLIERGQRFADEVDAGTRLLPKDRAKKKRTPEEREEEIRRRHETREAKQLAKERQKEERKRLAKGLQLTDVLSTLHTADVDGSGPREIVVNVNPAALLKAGGRAIAGSHTPDLGYYNILYDIGKIDALARGVDIRLHAETDVEYVDDARATFIFLEMLREIRNGCKRATIDLETYVEDDVRHTALMPYVARIRAIGIGTPDRAVCVLWDLLSPYAKEVLKAFLVDMTVTKGGHNFLLYDCAVFEANGFRIDGPTFDTMFLHHAAFPGVAHRLQLVTAQFYGVPPWKSEFRDGDESIPELVDYCAKDVAGTAKIEIPLAAWVRKTDTERVYEIDKVQGDIARAMHLVGVPIDRDVNEHLLQTFRKNVADAEEKILAIAHEPSIQERIRSFISYEQAKTRRKSDPVEFMPRYHTRLADLGKKEAKGKWAWSVTKNADIIGLLRALGINLYKLTPTGKISTSKAVFEDLIHHDIVREIVLYRENDKLLSTFLFRMFDRETKKGLVPGYTDRNSRCHPVWRTILISGRWASTTPVMSNVPKADKKKNRPNLRAQVVAPKGRIFCGFDFSQIEARLIALRSGDPWLTNVFATGQDIHTVCTREWYPGFDELKKADPERAKNVRDATKRFEYGAFYKGSIETLWKTLMKDGYQVKIADVEKAVRILMTKMARVPIWQDDCLRKATTPPYTIYSAILKRRRVFPLNVDPGEAVNSEIQPSAADIMNIGMWRMWQRLPKYNGYQTIQVGKGCYPLLQIHDACVYECDEDDADEVAKDIKECFEQEYGGVPFPVEIDIGKSWADV